MTPHTASTSRTLWKAASKHGDGHSITSTAVSASSPWRFVEWLAPRRWVRAGSKMLDDAAQIPRTEKETSTHTDTAYSPDLSSPSSIAERPQDRRATPGTNLVPYYGSESSDDNESVEPSTAEQPQLIGIHLPPPPSDASSYSTYEFVLRKRLTKRRFSPYQRPASANGRPVRCASESTDDDEPLKVPEPFHWKHHREVFDHAEPSLSARFSNGSSSPIPPVPEWTPSEPATPAAASPATPSTQSPHPRRAKAASDPGFRRLQTVGPRRAGSSSSSTRISKHKASKQASIKSNSACGPVPDRPLYIRKAMSCYQGLVRNWARLHRNAELANLCRWEAPYARPAESFHEFWPADGNFETTTCFEATNSVYEGANHLVDVRVAESSTWEDKAAEMTTLAWGQDWGNRPPRAYSESNGDQMVWLDREAGQRPLGEIYREGRERENDGELHPVVFGQDDPNEQDPDSVLAIESWVDGVVPSVTSNISLDFFDEVLAREEQERIKKEDFQSLNTALC